MKKSTIIDIAAFVIPAVLAFLSYSYGDMLYRVAYALAIGLVFFFPIGMITQGADAEYRANASTADKVILLIKIMVFPIAYFLLSSFYHNHNDEYRWERASIAWSSLAIGIVITLVVSKIFEYVIKLFRKD